ncbi:hypothetical protein RND61_13795 [Streptomyces sp. TRM76323]|uniref:Uncharacterized protein n=1 Tax=Streptomyces tamarix TaxID=3078565 RepID=A0ABU3QL76_9ACTN|nr:hypothetical protein [Streptomyces tamarix]MDT9683137.1 hypothetical protein [Streptomyces tamarix]
MLAESQNYTAKSNIWYAPDLRSRDGAPTPHSHPWDFESRILLGGYTEDRYVLTGGRVHPDLGVEHEQGTTNSVRRPIYHEVRELHTAPGATVTLMVCGQGERGKWAHLDPATGLTTPPERDPHFAARLRALNPHR